MQTRREALENTVELPLVGWLRLRNSETLDNLVSLQDGESSTSPRIYYMRGIYYAEIAILSEIERREHRNRMKENNGT